MDNQKKVKIETVKARGRNKVSRNGFVYLVGAGPGDVEYITIKGMEVLKKCDVVIYDRLASAELLRYIKADCRTIYVGKASGKHAMKQEEINRILVDEGKKNQMVVRLKGGDPFVFGRGGEEILALQEEKIDYEVIPGVTSAVAVPMASGIPVTHRGVSQSFHVVTGHTAYGEHCLTEHYDALAKTDGTLLFLMGLSNLERIVERLLGEGMKKDTPVAVVEQGTTVFQRSVRGTLETISVLVEQEKVKSPVVIVVGYVAGLDMCQQKKKIGFTGTTQFVDHMKEAVRENNRIASNYKYFAYPYVDITPIENEKIIEILNKINTFQWIVFTSSNGVRCFFTLMRKYKIDHRCMSMAKFAVIGKGTQKVLEEYGYVADLVPEEYYAETLGRALAKEIGEQAEKVLILRAQNASPKLTEQLKDNGVTFEDVAIYETIACKELLEQMISALPYLDAITFGSASGVKFLLDTIEKDKIQPYFSEKEIFCIGRETAAALKKYGIDAIKIAQNASIDGMMKLMEAEETE